MDDVERLFDKVVGEIDRLLSSKTVVGDPITVGENILIPLVSVGFGFGGGGGQCAAGNHRAVAGPTDARVQTGLAYVWS